MALKQMIAFFFFSSFFPAAAFAGPGCSGTSDACAADAKIQSPFLAASLAGNATTQVLPAPASSARPAAKAAAAAPAVAVSSTAIPSAQPSEGLSSPAWLLLVGSGFAGLYFYLRGGIRKRRRK